MKKRCLATLLILISNCLVSLGNAGTGNERWKAVVGKNGEERILYDTDSVIPYGPELFRVRITGFDKDHASRRSLEEFDCRNRIYRDIEVITETPNKPAQRTLTPSEWRGVVKDSPRGELFKVLCR